VDGIRQLFTGTYSRWIVLKRNIIRYKKNTEQVLYYYVETISSKKLKHIGPYTTGRFSFESLSVQPIYADYYYIII